MLVSKRQSLEAGSDDASRGRGRDDVMIALDR